MSKDDTQIRMNELHAMIDERGDLIRSMVEELEVYKRALKTIDGNGTTRLAAAIALAEGEAIDEERGRVSTRHMVLAMEAREERKKDKD